MNVEQYYVIDTWPKYNNLNRIHTGGGCSPTLTTQCSHSKPPLVIVENREYATKENDNCENEEKRN